MSAPRWLLTLVVCVLPRSTFAHPVFEGAGGFYGGLLHPLFVPAHLMAVAGLAALVARRETRQSKLWHSSTAMLIGMAVGLVAIANAYIPTLSSEIVLALDVVIGTLIASEIAPPRLVITGLALVTGFSVAIDSPPDAITIREAIAIQLGTFCGVTVLLIAMIEMVSRLRHRWQRIGIRIVGSWIAAIAAMALALQFTK
jgi:urease accessory protein